MLSIRGGGFDSAITAGGLPGGRGNGTGIEQEAGVHQNRRRQYDVRHPDKDQDSEPRQ
jgi:hypothetical protein